MIGCGRYPPCDLIVTLDDASGTTYSAFFIEEEGPLSSFHVDQVITPCNQHPFATPFVLGTDAASELLSTRIPFIRNLKMAKKPRASLKNPTSTVYDPASAPVIYFDGAPCYGSSGGIVHVTLAVGRHLLEENEVAVDAVAVAFLRCNIPAAKSLKEALDRALLMATPRTGGGGN